jgi:hypothetical protein
VTGFVGLTLTFWFYGRYYRFAFRPQVSCGEQLESGECHVERLSGENLDVDELCGVGI